MSSKRTYCDITSNYFASIKLNKKKHFFSKCQNIFFNKKDEGKSLSQYFTSMPIPCPVNVIMSEKDPFLRLISVTKGE